MGRLDALYQETNNLLNELRKLDDSKTDRDHVIQNVDQLIGKREALMKQLAKPYTEDEMKIGQLIIGLNEEIKDRMNHLYAEIKKDMKQVQQRKAQNYSYINPYGKIKTTDGMYMDSKL